MFGERVLIDGGCCLCEVDGYKLGYLGVLDRVDEWVGGGSLDTLNYSGRTLFTSLDTGQAEVVQRASS